MTEWTRGAGRAQRPGDDGDHEPARGAQRRQRPDGRRACRRVRGVRRGRLGIGCGAWGDNGTFCAGADLKAFGTPDANPVHRDGPGPMGPTRMVLSKPVIAAVSGLRGRGRPGAGAVVRPAGGRGGRGVRRVLPSLGRAADRRRHGPAAAADRPQPGDGHDPHRPRASTPTRRSRWGWPTAWCPKGKRANAPRSSPPNSPRCRSNACGRIGCRRCTSGECPKPTRIDFEFGSISRVAAESMEGAAPIRRRRRSARHVGAERPSPC